MERHLYEGPLSRSTYGVEEKKTEPVIAHKAVRLFAAPASHQTALHTLEAEKELIDPATGMPLRETLVLSKNRPRPPCPHCTHPGHMGNAECGHPFEIDELTCPCKYGSLEFESYGPRQNDDPAGTAFANGLTSDLFQNLSRELPKRNEPKIRDIYMLGVMLDWTDR